MNEHSALLAQLTRAVVTTATDAPLPLRLCTALVKILGVEGGSMTVDVTAPSRETLCATDDFAERLEDLQNVLGEGPTLEASRLGRPVMVSPEELSASSPMLARFMSEQLSAAYLLAVPMCPGGEVLGVLTLYSHQPMVGDHGPDEAQYLANAIGVAVLGAVEHDAPSDQLWSARDRVNQAVGMVVAQLRIRPDDALAVLRAHAFAHSTTMSHIADQVLSGALDFQAGPDGGSHIQGDR